jgi:hypothetical protein
MFFVRNEMRNDLRHGSHWCDVAQDTKSSPGLQAELAARGK